MVSLLMNSGSTPSKGREDPDDPDFGGDRNLWKSIGGMCFPSRQGHETFVPSKISDWITFSGKNKEKNRRGNNL